MKVFQRQVDANSRIKTPKLSEKNPVLLGDLSVRTVLHLLHDDLSLIVILRKRKTKITFCRKYLQ